jgi:PAS domain S-box-containing protein
MKEAARQQEKLLHDLTLFRTLLDQSSDAIKVIDLESLRFLDVNERSYEELGYSREELLSMTVCDIDPNADKNLLERVRQQLKETGFAIMETVHRRKDGTTFPVEVNMRQVRLDREYCVSISRDITVRKRAEERLREFERVVENLEEMIVVIDREYRYVLANRAYLRYRGMTKEQLVGRSSAESLNPGVFEAVVKEKLDKCFQGQVVDYELRYQYPEMGERDLSIRYLPVEGPTGIDRVACIVRDITEPKRAEERLRAFERVVEHLEEMIVVVDREYRYVLANRAFLRYRGLTKDQVVGQLAAEVLNPGVFEAVVKEKLDECFRGKVVDYELRYEYREMGERDLSIVSLPVEGPTGIERVASVIRDVTEHKRAAAMLRESELRFRTVYERSPLGIALVDSRSGRFLQVNPICCEITGRAEEELLRTDVGSITHSDDIGPTRETLQQLAEEKVENYELVKRYLRPDGSVRWVRVLAVPMWRKGEQQRWHMGLVEDITDRKHAEEENARLMRELREAERKLTEEKLYLKQEIDTELGFGEIIGQSKALQAVMAQVRKVASSDATVLLLGETGTGKELVARAIHRLSRRADRSFIKLNCAAIPSGLLESELFGNEMGAFTGAVSRKIGRLELADKGTLFLDEIGEISLTLQPKLLRVLQDQEFERLGGLETLKVDFRLIAATNRNLADSLRENEFRSDLYYRLNVFPVRVPPLRERREDIQLLVEHFVHKFAQRMKKSITSIPTSTMQALKHWEWPGNVRELENFIERSVILTQGSVLVSPLSELRSMPAENDERLEAAEREHILRALRDSRGQIGGLRGAATRLGLKRTTLQSKLKHLGIDPRRGSTQH